MKNTIKITNDWSLCDDRIYWRLFHFNCPKSVDGLPERCFQGKSFNPPRGTYCDTCNADAPQEVAQKAKLLGEWTLVKFP